MTLYWKFRRLYELERAAGHIRLSKMYGHIALLINESNKLHGLNKGA